MPGEDGLSLLPLLASADKQPLLILMSGEAPGIIESAKASAEHLGLRVLGALRKPFFANDLETLLDHL